VSNKVLLGTMCAVLALPVRSFSAGREPDPGQLTQAAGSAFQSGNFALAGELCTAAIRDLEAAGVTDHRLASSLLNLGRVREVQGRCGEASDLFLRAIRILEAAPQPDPFQRSDAWGALAKAYNCQHQYSKAELALRRALEIEQSAPAPRSDQLVELLAGQGGVYEAEGKFAEAEAAFLRAQSLLNQDPRVDSNRAALLLNNLGALRRLMGRYVESEAAFLQGLSLAEAAATWDLGLEVGLLYNLAALDVERKQFREAANHFAKAVRLLDNTTSLPPRTIGDLLRNYAACLRKVGDRRQATTLDTRAAALLNSQPDGNGRLIVDVTELSSK